MKTVVRTLPCELSEEEINDRGRMLAQSELELGALKEEAKESAALFKLNIKSQEVIVDRLATQVSTGQENRYIQCTWVLNSPVRGMKALVRTDTNEVIEDREMTDMDKAEFHESLQLKLA